MGQGYAARDTRLNRDVALKVLPDSFASDPERIARFTREAQTLASLNHPHIAQIHGFEQSGDLRALAMELVDGEDLSERIARGAIPIEEAQRLAETLPDRLLQPTVKMWFGRHLAGRGADVRPRGLALLEDAAADFELLGMPLHRDRARTWRADADREQE